MATGSGSGSGAAFVSAGCSELRGRPDGALEASGTLRVSPFLALVSSAANTACSSWSSRTPGRTPVPEITNAAYGPRWTYAHS